VSAAGGLYDQLQRENRRSTRVLLGLGALLVALLVWLLVGYLAAPIAFDPVTGPLVVLAGAGFGLGATYLSVRGGPAIALRAAKARPADRQAYPELHNVFDEVCVSAGILGQKPKLYVVDDPAPNAFATGLSLDDSHIAVTTGLLERLPRYELRAVLAHEVAHVVNDDIRAVTVAVATAGVVALLADVLVRALWIGGARGGRGGNRGGNNSSGPAQLILLVVGLLAVVLAPIAAQLIRFAVSRQREYLADATAADLLRDPQSMVNALRRLDADPTSLQRFEAATAHLWFEEPNDTTGQGQEAKLARRFATHPSIHERIERLASLNAGTVRTDAPLPPRPDAGRPPPPPPQSGGDLPPPGPGTPRADLPPPPPGAGPTSGPPPWGPPQGRG
jgi:heat shock protein HtpX